MSGKSFKFLGRQYRLKVEESNEEKVKYRAGYIYLFVMNSSNIKKKEKLFTKWFR